MHLKKTGSNSNFVYWFLIQIIAIFLCVNSEAYPEFIGYGYSSCLTCHYNGNGNGPLTDYGRALWSGEIASRFVFSKKMTDEDIAGTSGFLGRTEMPVWFRPHMKYRGIKVNSNPGSKSQGSSKFYEMQTDFGFAIQDAASKYVAVITIGRVLPPSDYGKATPGLSHLMARDAYLRLGLDKTWWLYAGLLEKVYGLRNIDHTSYQRTYQGFNMQGDSTDGTAESQGLILQKIETSWEVSTNLFFGSPYDSADYKQSGASLMSEFEIGENKRIGASAMMAQNKLLKKNLIGVHYRQALSKGSALMTEWGLIKDSPVSTSETLGSYGLVESLISISRGYNFKTTIERYNKEFKSSSPDQWKVAFGFLIFPFPRLELRLDAVNYRNFSGQAAAEDSWNLLGQIHVSL